MEIKNTYLAFYDSEVLTALQEIFDLAWLQITSATGYRSSDVEERRNDLALMIMLAHRSGLNPEEIKTALIGIDTIEWRAAAAKLSSKFA